jgi:hypothetical protein
MEEGFRVESKPWPGRNCKSSNKLTNKQGPSQKEKSVKSQNFLTPPFPVVTQKYTQVLLRLRW